MLKENLWNLRRNILFSKGIDEGRIVPFDEEFYNGMKTTYFNGLPIYMHMKYLKPSSLPGKCFDRSLFMFWCYADSLLVRADDKDLEIRFGKDNAGHGWIERENYVYDPSLLLRFDKDLYYQIYKPYNISKTTKEEYEEYTDGAYEQYISRNIEDFMPDGKERTSLIISIPLVKGIAEMSGNRDFQKELQDYLALIQYDEKEIQEEMDSKFRELMNDQIARSSLSHK